MLYGNKFGFQRNNSTNHAILQLLEDGSNCFDQDEFTLGDLMHLSKDIDTVYHKILLKILRLYGITDTYHGLPVIRKDVNSV